jgi:hypothetical protein
VKTQIVNMPQEIGAGLECGPCRVVHLGSNEMYECNYLQPVPGKPMLLMQTTSGRVLRCPACLEEWPVEG